MGKRRYTVVMTDDGYYDIQFLGAGAFRMGINFESIEKAKLYMNFWYPDWSYMKEPDEGLYE